VALIDSLVADLRSTSWPELASVVLGIAYALLAVRQRRECWLFGGASSLLLVWLAARASLPMQALLQACYVAMSGYGFWQWGRGADDRPPGVATWPLSSHLFAGLVIAAATWLLAPWVSAWTHAAWPRLDTATMLASLLATWMVTRVLLENWVYWIVIDAISLFLYAAQGLVFVSTLYLAYMVIAVFGYAAWRKKLHSQASTH
jgi:nicotinamide mononucleotide transporter